ncbi:MAG: molybdopterin-binding protein [Bacteroidetes bacterium]|nr:molybdopterin-binding protein [Bacteroidota bacterium]
MKYILSLLFATYCIAAYSQRDIPATDKFTICGDIPKEITYTIGDILKYSQVTLNDMVIKNHKGEDKGTAKNLKGVLLKPLLDSAHITFEKPKELSEYYFVFIASDGYKNVYSWNEIFNTSIGDGIYIITEKDGKQLPDIEQHIIVVSLKDINTGRRYLKGLSKIEVHRAK